MAVFSTHTLNALDGTHAGGVRVTLSRLDRSGVRLTLFEASTDEGGRLSETLALSPEDAQAQFELVFGTGAYFAAQPAPVSALQEVVFRFAMPDPQGRYHIPLILAPNGCSAWWSS